LAERPPAAPKDEELAELSDDVIIAQESRAHAPQPRVRIDFDPRTVVIADDAEQQAAGQRAAAPEPVRELPLFTHATEKTVVIRDRRTLGSSRPPQHSSAPPHRDQRVLILLMCLVAALLAFSLGGALAMLLSRRGPPPASAGAPVPGASER
jgi:hypothetical protein